MLKIKIIGRDKNNFRKIFTGAKNGTLSDNLHLENIGGICLNCGVDIAQENAKLGRNLSDSQFGQEWKKSHSDAKGTKLPN